MPIEWLEPGLTLAEQVISAAAHYPALWQHVTREWREDDSADKGWLTYSANYLFSTGGLKWAIDPFSLSSRVSGVPVPDFSRDLQGLELVLLTHEHNDHLDLNLLRALRDQPLTWVIPSFLQPRIAEKVNLPAERILTPQVGGSFHYKNLTITAFDALHFNGKRGVPELGYLVEMKGKRWLFPGDTRNYDRTQLPEFGRLDAVFAHLWLGKACALDAEPPLMDAFCNFYSGFDTNKLIVTHLYEFGREADDLWARKHFALVKAVLQQRSGLAVESALMGEQVDL
ncbi:MAG TPA: MBL fold metallo-hydrolase [Anaerolineaceae bacterium]|nr:MBL fold metallo-hydrolase [Anaerolineaceae bacterium]